MKIPLIEQLSFLLLVISVWCALTLITVVLAAYGLVRIGVALLNLPMALLRGGRG